MKPAFVYSPPCDPLDVLHADSAVLVVVKPAGLLSVPGRAEQHRDCLQTRLTMVYPDALLVHRLDMDTSGLMVFARTRAAQRNLGRQFETRVVEKQYVARVSGNLQPTKGTVDVALAADWPNRPLQKIDPENGKQAITHWQVIDRGAQSTLVRLTPQTGRSHQLRVHMLSLGHPILGDRFYAPPEIIVKSPRLMLHAQALAFSHPETGQRQDFDSPYPF